jgi:uncharacterized Zn-binding protein involved in type VI secretion
MPGRIVKITDLTQGHTAPPTAIQSYSIFNVIVNGVSPVVVGDSYMPHPNPGSDVHPVYAIVGSPTVFINGIPVVREGDPLSCGDIAAVQAGNVFCG